MASKQTMYIHSKRIVARSRRQSTPKNKAKIFDTLLFSIYVAETVLSLIYKS